MRQRCECQSGFGGSAVLGLALSRRTLGRDFPIGTVAKLRATTELVARGGQDQGVGAAGVLLGRLGIDELAKAGFGCNKVRQAAMIQRRVKGIVRVLHLSRLLAYALIVAVAQPRACADHQQAQQRQQQARGQQALAQPTGAGGARDDLRRAEALKDGPNLGVLGRCRFRGRGFGDRRFQQRCLQNSSAAEVIAFGHRQCRAIHHVGAIQIDLGRRHRQRGCVRRRQLGD